MLEFLHRKDLAYRETATHIILRGALGSMGVVGWLSLVCGCGFWFHHPQGCVRWVCGVAVDPGWVVAGGRIRPAAVVVAVAVAVWVWNAACSLARMHPSIHTQTLTRSHAFIQTQTQIECPFCPKPTLGRADNEWKLYLSKDGGAWFCHRCGDKGSWFDFKRRWVVGLGLGCVLAVFWRCLDWLIE